MFHAFGHSLDYLKVIGIYMHMINGQTLTTRQKKHHSLRRLEFV